MTPKLNKKLRALGLTYEVTNKGHVRIYPINQKGPSVFIPHSSGSCRVGRDIYSQLNNTFFPEY
jgi:hypothetical protein